MANPTVEFPDHYFTIQCFVGLLQGEPHCTVSRSFFYYTVLCRFASRQTPLYSFLIIILLYSALQVCFKANPTVQFPDHYFTIQCFAGLLHGKPHCTVYRLLFYYTVLCRFASWQTPLYSLRIIILLYSALQVCFVANPTVQFTDYNFTIQCFAGLLLGKPHCTVYRLLFYYTVLCRFASWQTPLYSLQVIILLYSALQVCFKANPTA
jgi:hypothetical protein